ncbi:MAG: FHA domain-containing protein [Alloprevotella sp.]|nr:FHA domain-containing protein [Alloprevotella sp.]
MQIILGRDEKTHKLKAVVDGKTTKLLGPEGAVNDFVSRQHVSLDINDASGTFVLKNLKSGNQTYVNGQLVVQKNVTTSDRVELGAQRYVLDWKLVSEVLPKVADVRPLKKVWADYQTDMLKEKISQGRFNALRGGAGVLSALSMAGTFVPGAGSLRIPLIAIFVVSLIVLTVISMRNAKKLPLRQQERQKNFQRNYVCPRCGHFFGTMDYDVVIKPKDVCPNCKAKLVK